MRKRVKTRMNMKSHVKGVLVTFAVLAVLLMVSLTFSGCARQSQRVAYNISQEADNFNVQRRLTVINARTDKVLLQMVGNFAIQNNDNNELEVICEISDGKYQKHMIYLNDWTMYTVEDLSGAEVSNYSYELNFMPETIPGVKIVRKK